MYPEIMYPTNKEIKEHQWLVTHRVQNYFRIQHILAITLYATNTNEIFTP